MVRFRRQTRLRRLMLIVGFVGVVLALVARREHFRRIANVYEARAAPVRLAKGWLVGPVSPIPLIPGRVGITNPELYEDAVRYDWLITTLAVGATFLWAVDVLGVLHRHRLRGLARQFAPPPRPEPYRPPDHSEMLESHSYPCKGEPRSIVRERQ